MRRNGTRFALISAGEKGYQPLLLRLSAVLRNALAMCGKLIRHCNFFHKTTCPEFRPSLPPGRVPRAWTATEGPVASSNGLAEITQPECMEAVDGARRRERAGGNRDGHTPCADAARTQTDGTRRV